MSKKPKTALTVRVDDNLLQNFKKACDDLGYSQGFVIQELLKKWLADKKQGELFRWPFPITLFLPRQGQALAPKGRILHLWQVT